MKKELSQAEKIAVCGVMLLGREYLPTAFSMSHPQAKTTSETSLKVMRSRWWAADLVQQFRADITARLAGTAIATGNDLTTRDGLISELIVAVKQSKGKDTISGLQSLAKLQGLDKPGDQETREMRTYFLPWRSKCRGCRLMQIYKEVENAL